MTDNPPDSYSYMSGTLELLEHHRYSLRTHPRCPVLPQDAPTTAVCRMPGYSIALAIMVPWARTYASFELPVRVWNALFDFAVAAMIIAIGSRLAGKDTGLLAGAIYWVHPMVLRYSLAILTEPLATLLATSTMALLILKPAWLRPRIRYCIAGTLLGASLVMRIDTLLFVPLLVVAAWFDDGPGRRRAGYALVGVVSALAVFSIWPARNVIAIGRPNPMGGPLCDMCGLPIPGSGAKRWLATWLVREENVGLDWRLIAGGQPLTIDSYPDAAFDTKEERITVERLLLRRRSEGLTDGISREFGALAAARVNAHKIRSLVVIPIERAFWLVYERRTDVTWPNYILRNVPAPLARVVRWLPVTSIATLLLALVGVILGITMRRHRPVIILLSSSVILRCSAIALVGQVEQRYSHQILPSLLLLATWGGVQAVRRLRRADP